MMHIMKKTVAAFIKHPLTLDTVFTLVVWVPYNLSAQYRRHPPFRIKARDIYKVISAAFTIYMY